MLNRLRRIVAWLRRLWNSPWTGAVLLAVVAVVIACWLLGCGSGSGTSQRIKDAGDALVGDFNPWTMMGWIGAACLIAAAFFAINMKLVQAVMSLATGIAFLFLSSFLKKYGTIVILGGVGAAVWFAASNWGMVREQIRAWFAARKLEIEGKDREATALKRLAFPIMDWRMERESRRRKKAVNNSGTIKPVAAVPKKDA